MQQYNKAIIALLAPALVAIGARYGLALSTEEAAILASLVTGLIVYLVPNKQQPQVSLDHNIEAYTKTLEQKVRQQIEQELAQQPLTIHREEDER